VAQVVRPENIIYGSRILLPYIYLTTIALGWRVEQVLPLRTADKHHYGNPIVRKCRADSAGISKERITEIR
jgi:hypothetical protein